MMSWTHKTNGRTTAHKLMRDSRKLMIWGTYSGVTIQLSHGNSGCSMIVPDEDLEGLAEALAEAYAHHRERSAPKEG